MKLIKKAISIKTRNQDELKDITYKIKEIVKKSHITNGYVMLFVPHTTAAVSINENADADVKRDILLGLNDSFPTDLDFRHAEGNSHAHIKSSVIGASETVLIENGELVLGTWQGIYFCEFDGPRTRSLHIQVIGE